MFLLSFSITISVDKVLPSFLSRLILVPYIFFHLLFLFSSLTYLLFTCLCLHLFKTFRFPTKFSCLIHYLKMVITGSFISNRNTVPLSVFILVCTFILLGLTMKFTFFIDLLKYCHLNF